MALFKKCGYFSLLLAVAIASLTFFLRRHRVTKGMIPLTSPNINFNFEQVPDLTNQIVIVTGANRGLGKSSASGFALNGATTIMACRSLSKCEETKQELIKQNNGKKRFNSKNLVCMELDLSSLSSIKSFYENFKKKYKKLNSLVLNAGVIHTPYSLTENGVESQFGINHLGHYYLTRLLLPLLDTTQPSTIVIVSSTGQFLSYSEGVKLNLSDINDPKTYNPILAYGQSKLCNVLFAQELSDRLSSDKKNIFVNHFNPGGMVTEFPRLFNGVILQILNQVTKKFPNTVLFEPDYSSLNALYLAFSPNITKNNVTGKYFVSIAEESEPSEFAKNKSLQKQLWTFTETLLDDLGFP